MSAAPKHLVPFGNYLLDEEIARGGMARVFRARLRGLGGFEKTLVVKQVLPELAADPRFVEMFVQEAKTLVRMSHPHIVPIYELGVIDGVYFLAMEYVDGASVGDLVADAPLSAPLVAHLAAQVCDALHYAHDRFGLVHRDVTPRNIVIDSGGNARLLDFGIAAPAEETDGEVFGSPGYMAPEQMRGEAVDARSDIFGLGAVLYRLLTGEHAFLRTSPELTRAAVLDRPPPRFSDHREVPDGFAAILDETLAADREDRPKSAARLGQRLRGWLASTRPEGVGAELGERAAAAADRIREQRERTPAPDLEEKKEPSRVVRTLATSPILHAMLEGHEPPVVATAALAESEVGTVKIAGRGAEPRADDPRADDPRAEPEVAEDEPQVRTQAIADRATVELAATGAPVSAPPGPLRRGAPFLVTLAIGAALALALAPGAVDETPAVVAPVAPSPEPALMVEPPAPEPTPPTPEVAPSVMVEVPIEPTPSKATSAAVVRATLTLIAQPWATVSLDGRRLGETPIRGHRVPIGTHRLVFDNPPLGRRVTRTITVTAGDHLRVSANLGADPPTVTQR